MQAGNALCVDALFLASSCNLSALILEVSLSKEVLQSFWGFGRWEDKGGERLYSDPNIILNELSSFSCLFLSKGILDTLRE